MKLKSTRLSLAVFVLGLSTLCSQAQTGAQCWTANPAVRPSGSTPSNWNLQYVLKAMITPQPNLILVTSHRGFWEYCPENTLQSFQSAWDNTAEAAEMDVRLAQGATAGSLGEAFLSHDFDVRGEAPNTLGQPSNYIYALTSAQLKARSMADRHGKLINDTDGNPLHMASFTDLLTSYLQRAQLITGAIGSQESPVTGTTRKWDLLKRGMLLVIDVKGTEQTKTDGTIVGANQYTTFLECLKEMYAFEDANNIDLRYAVTFKVGYGDFYKILNPPPPGQTWVQKAVTDVTSASIGYKTNMALAPLIFIVFPKNVCTTTACTAIISPGSSADELHNFLVGYQIGTDSTTNGFLVCDWQHRNESDGLTTYLTYSDWANRGAAMFLASNNFSDGVRNSGGNCKTTFSDTNNPPTNTSYCVSDPVQRWNSSSIDYLVPSFGPRHSTSITTDQYQNALNYLNSIGQNQTAYIAQ